jgi:hypothetical protein
LPTKNRKVNNQLKKEKALRQLYRVFCGGIFFCVALIGVFGLLGNLYFQGIPIFIPLLLVCSGIAFGSLLLALFWLRDKLGVTKPEIRNYFFKQPLSRWVGWIMFGVVILGLLRICGVLSK